MPRPSSFWRCIFSAWTSSSAGGCKRGEKIICNSSWNWWLCSYWELFNDWLCIFLHFLWTLGFKNKELSEDIIVIIWFYCVAPLVIWRPLLLSSLYELSFLFYCNNVNLTKVHLRFCLPSKLAQDPFTGAQPTAAGSVKTHRSSLRPKTLMSRQHSLISALVAWWDSKSLLSKVIWMERTKPERVWWFLTELKLVRKKRGVLDKPLSSITRFSVKFRKLCCIPACELEVDLSSHLTGFAQEVDGVVCFQKGRYCETVEERHITICVSLCLKQRGGCMVSKEAFFGITYCFAHKHSICEWDSWLMSSNNV